VPKTIFLFADSALELMPKELYNEEIIKKYASKKRKKPSQLILDSTYHHIPMKKLSNFKKRGRPDIIHFCLMNLIESTFVLDNLSQVEIYVHTIDNKIIDVKPHTRLPKNLERFKGLIAKLFKNQIIEADGNILLKMLNNDCPKSILQSINSENRLLFTSKGKENYINEILDVNKSKDIAFIIGAFPYGNFSKDINNLTNKTISIYPESLNAWIVLNKIIFLRESTIT
jgi:rRNA small subunit pseudouridine methyltransferase Nep1